MACQLLFLPGSCFPPLQCEITNYKLRITNYGQKKVVVAVSPPHLVDLPVIARQALPAVAIRFPYPCYIYEIATKGVRIATPVCGLARNDIGFRWILQPTDRRLPRSLRSLAMTGGVRWIQQPTDRRLPRRALPASQ